MIRYDLICGDGHEFDGWFAGSAAFDTLNQDGHVTCPVCGSAKIEKQLMTPGVPAKSNARDDQRRKLAAGPKTPEQRALIETMRKLRQHVEANAEYVGESFAEEARRIHYNESEARGIYGEASLEDAKSLIDDGVEIAPLPRLPEDDN